MIAMKLRLLSAVSVLAALFSGCSFEADLSDLQITQHGLIVPGVPQTTLGSPSSTRSSFPLSSADVAWAKGMKTDVLVHQVRIVASDSLFTLDFIDWARVTAAAPSSSESAIPIMNYERTEQAPSSTVIDVSIPSPVNITTVWSADETVIELQMAGQLPEEDWTVDVALNLSGKITYTL
ncbi:MAG TPA: hypothetical protein VJ860_14260 [Polyangia bacterium]|jgi:hypothetical protein|nr:hypothetical protein [Polyangia bacterium]